LEGLAGYLSMFMIEWLQLTDEKNLRLMCINYPVTVSRDTEMHLASFD